MEPPGIIGALCNCVDLDRSHRAVLKESVWVLANLLGGGGGSAGAVLNAGTLQKIIPALYCEYFDVQREALIALRHACQTTAVVLRLSNGGADAIRPCSSSSWLFWTCQTREALTQVPLR